MLHQKFGMKGFHNEVMTLHFIYKTTNITWLPFLRLVCDVTCYVVFYTGAMADSARLLCKGSYEIKCAG